MRRLSLFFGAMSWGARLQTLLVAMILAFYAWFDFQHGWLPVYLAIAVATWGMGWLLRPLMIAHPRMTHKIWGAFGIVFLAMFVFARNEWWWKTVLAHFCCEIFIWLELSCGYWFISEIQLIRLRVEKSDPWMDDEHSETEPEQIVDQ